MGREQEAGVGRARAPARAMAFALETSLALGLSAALGAALRGPGSTDAVPVLAGLGVICAWLVADLLSAWRFGATPAQLLLRLRVVGGDGRGLSLLRATIRQLAFLAEVILALLIVATVALLGTEAVVLLRGDRDRVVLGALFAMVGAIAWATFLFASLERDPRSLGDRLVRSAVVSSGRGRSVPGPLAPWTPRYRTSAYALGLSVVVTAVAVGGYATLASPVSLRLDGLGQESALPATLLHLRLRGLNEGERLYLRFFDDAGATEVPVRLVGPGEAVAAVPAYTDPRTQESGAATVKAQLVASSARGARTSNVVEGFRIEDLPRPRAPLGAVTLRLLEVIDVLPGTAHERFAAAERASRGSAAASLRDALDRLVTESAAALGRFYAQAGDPALAELGVLLGLADRISATYVVALSSTPNPCPAKDVHLDAFLHGPRDPDVTNDAGRRFWTAVARCPAADLVEIAERSAAWLGAIVPTVQDNDSFGAQLVTTLLLGPFVVSTYVVLATTGATLVERGGPEAARGLGLVSEIVELSAQPATNLLRAMLRAEQLVFRQALASALAIGAALLRVAGDTGASTVRRQVPMVSPRITPAPKGSGTQP